MASHPALLGSGLAWPLRIDPATNDFARASDESNVASCVHQLVMTEPTERMDPAIGTVVPSLVFEEMDVAEDLAEPSIRACIAEYEPRIRLTRIRVQDRGAGQLAIMLGYGIRATNSRHNLVVDIDPPKEQ